MRFFGLCSGVVVRTGLCSPRTSGWCPRRAASTRVIVCDVLTEAVRWLLQGAPCVASDMDPHVFYLQWCMEGVWTWVRGVCRTNRSVAALCRWLPWPCRAVRLVPPLQWCLKEAPRALLVSYRIPIPHCRAVVVAVVSVCVLA